MTRSFARSIAATVAASEKCVTVALLFIGIGCIVFLNPNPNKKELIGEIAGYANLIAYVPYFMSIVGGGTKPSRVTWWAWAVLEIMMTISYIMSGAESTMWLPIASCIGMLFTAILSLRFGKKEWTIVDSICSVGAVIGMIVWIASGNPVLALGCFLAVDLMAAVPTFIKSWEKPEEEDLFAWVVTLLSGIVNLFAIEVWNFSIAVLPMYNLAIYAVVVAILIHIRITKRF